jgi:mannose-1-phosphate guanylyltransferase
LILEKVVMAIHALILAGGSGTRFWPASRKQRPKQLLKLGPTEGTLLEAAVLRLGAYCSAENTVIATGKHLLAATRQLLPHVPEASLLGEPYAKNTAPCIGWGVELIARQDPQAIVIVVPSDQYIADVPGYEKALACAIEAARAGEIVTLGIKPTRPETGYGYIEVGGELSGGVFRAKRFVEKPNLETAGRYVQAGTFFWNAGMFIFRADVMLAEFQKSMPELYQGLLQVRAAAAESPEVEAAAVERLFAKTESISIDYGIMEKCERVAVVPADVGWSDLGSYQVAWELAERDAAGNVLPPHALQVDSQGNLVLDLRHNVPSQRTIALVGVKDMCVIQTDDALLVIPRERCQDVRDIVELLKQSGRSELL